MSKRLNKATLNKPCKKRKTILEDEIVNQEDEVGIMADVTADALVATSISTQTLSVSSSSNLNNTTNNGTLIVNGNTTVQNLNSLGTLTCANINATNTTSTNNVFSNLTATTSASFANNMYADNGPVRKLSGPFALKRDTTAAYSSAAAIKIVSTWNTRTTPADNTYRAICWSPELLLFAAASISGSGNRIMTSPDGITWTSQSSAADNNWAGICWSSERGLFVAVAGSGTGNRIMTSNNGSTWATKTSVADYLWSAICWSPELGLFVAVSSFGPGLTNRIMTSPDGNTWTGRSIPVDIGLTGVCWSAELSLFVATAASGTGNRVMTSPDGTTWTSRSSAADLSWVSVCWASKIALFVAVANNGSGNRVMTSPNGINWTTRTPVDNSWAGLCWAPDIGLLLAVSYSGTGNRVMTSPDGITWTTRTSAADNAWTAVCWAPELSLFAAVSDTGSGNRVMTSSISDRYPTSNNLYGTITPINGNLGVGITPTEKLHANGNGLLTGYLTASKFRGGANPISTASNAVVAIGSGQDNAGAVSNASAISFSYNTGGYDHFIRARHYSAGLAGNNIDFYTNTGSTSGASLPPTGLSVTNAGNKLAATIGSTGVGIGVISPTESLHVLGNIRVSGTVKSDTQTFAYVDYLQTQTYKDLGFTCLNDLYVGTAGSGYRSSCWSPRLGIFVGVSSTQILTSTNGYSWTAQTTPTPCEWWSVCWSPELGMFAAVGANTVKIATSTNGITWIPRTHPATGGTWWKSVCWSKGLGLFVAVSTNGTNRVMTSSDGVTWTARAAAQANTWYSVCWAQELTLLVAVSIDGTNRVMTSSDGTNWTSKTPYTSQWRSVCWANDLGIFVAVAYFAAAGFSIMTSPDGTTWTLRTCPATRDFNCVCYAQDIQLFIAGGINSSEDYNLMISQDGITWYSKYSSAGGVQQQIDTICWSPGLGIFNCSGIGSYCFNSTYAYPRDPNYIRPVYYSRARLYSRSLATVPSGNVIPYDTSLCAPSNITANLATGRITILKAATYRVVFSGMSNNSDVVYEVYLRKNGTMILRQKTSKLGTDYSASLVIDVLLDLAVTDYLDIYVFAGSALGTDASMFNVQEIL